jgi:23S rRNA (uracil1939-C5)-methyltransferase
VTRTVRIEKLAPTGEGIARTADGIGFIDRALPGELVETNVYEVRRSFWRGSLRAVRERSRDRLETPHAPCGGCDWAHFEPSAARDAKRELFFETMRRIGKLDSDLFGELPVAPSSEGYRLRTRFHVAGRRDGVMLGFFAPGSHRVVPASDCAAVSRQTRAVLPALRAAVADSGAGVSEVAILEDIAGERRLLRASVSGNALEQATLGEILAGSFGGVRIETAEGGVLLERGARTLRLEVGGRPFAVSVDTFFQANRHLVSLLFADVEEEARRVSASEALDAFGGVGLFAGALLSAGHRVTSIESEAGAVADARKTRELWPDRDRWNVIASDVGPFLEEGRRFECVVADPPRAGLGSTLSHDLARRTGRLIIYVSCDPATLARDLSVIRREGFEIRRAALYDLFAFTHRIEAMVSLERVA